MRVDIANLCPFLWINLENLRNECLSIIRNEVRNLMLCTELKIRASSKGIHSVEIEGSKLMMKRNDEFILIEGKFPRINTNKNEERLKKAVDLLKKF